jgi:cytoskeletal protein RodZ
MNNLMSADGPQLQAAYERYSSDVDRLKKQSAVVAADGAYLNKQSDTYLADWHKQSNDINDSSLRANSEQDRKTLRDRFTTTQDSYDRAAAAMSRLIGNFEDIRTALRNDLTARGVQGIAQAGVVKNAEANAKQAKDGLSEVQSQSTALAEALSPAAQPVAATNNSSNASGTSSQGSSK